MSSRLRLIFKVISSAIFLCGCLEHDEEIRVNADGSVEVRRLAKGDREDLYGGIALPSGPGWAIKEWSETDSEGHEQCFYLATGRFGSAAEIPQTFEKSRPELALRCVTSVSIERKPGFQIYEFTRVFKGRDAHKYDVLKETKIEKTLSEKAEKEGLDAFLPEEKRAYFEQVAEVELESQVLRHEEAMVELVKEGRLSMATREAALGSFRSILGDWLRSAIERAVVGSEADLASLGEEWKAKKAEAQRVSVEKTIEDPDLAHALLQAIEATEFKWSITEDLSDDSFKLRVNLPGRIFWTNGLVNESGQATWEFDGSELQGGDLTCRAYSIAEP